MMNAVSLRVGALAACLASHTQIAPQPSHAVADVAIAASVAEPPTNDWRPIADRVEAAARAEYDKNPHGALSVALIAQGKIVWTGHYGHVNGPESAAPTGTTLYRLGSITKSFTALMLLKLEGDDKCALSDPIGKYVPEFKSVPNQPPSGAQPTLIELATHTSGLAREPEAQDQFASGSVGEWEATLSRMIPNIRYAAEPGSVYNYSNVGYALLGSALAKAAGVSYTRYVSEQILKPLRMDDTVFELTPELRARLAIGHQFQGGVDDTTLPAHELEGRGYRVPNGGLFSTLDDLARWTRFQMGDAGQTVFDPKELRAAQQRLITTRPNLDEGYGVGTQFKKFGETVVWGHNGGTPGYRSDFLFDPRARIGIVMLRSALGDTFDAQAILGSAFGTKSTTR